MTAVIEVPLSRFIDFVGAKSPDARERKIVEIKRQLEEGYSPFGDPYKLLREKIIAANGQPLRDDDLEDLRINSTRVDLHALGKRYNKFVKLGLKPHPPRKGTWEFSDPSEGTLRIKVNPDIAYFFGNEDHPRQVKFYFKKGPPDKRQAKIAYQAMHEALHLPADQLAIVALRRRLSPPQEAIIPIHSKVSSSELQKLLRREAKFFLITWNDV